MKPSTEKQKITKVPIGIKGIDEITYGGFPYARPTLISGYAGSGKTVLAMQFILNGIQIYDEPGVFISMEETEDDLRKNMASFGYDLTEMEKNNKLCLENIKIRQTALSHNGQFDLTPIFLRIEEAVNLVGAKRIAIDTFDLIFNDIQDENVFRHELMRLIVWLKERNLSAIFTSESPKDPYARSGIEEFITDCVIELKHNKVENIYTRRFHILKYRGSRHGTNEYPFLIDQNGITLLPVTSVQKHQISTEVISTGIRGLDNKIQNKGLYVGSSTLVSGPSGVGKTSFSVSICIEALKQSKKCLFFTFEETPSQLTRNMGPLGFDLKEYQDKGLLKIISTRPTLFGIESHLVSIYHHVEEFEPDLIVFDPVTDLIQIGTKIEVRSMLFRIIDYLKSQLITILFTALINQTNQEHNLGMSSLVDNWIRLKPGGSEKDKIYIKIIKVRGMKHSRLKYILDFSESGLNIREHEKN